MTEKPWKLPPNPFSIEENIAIFRKWNREDCRLAVKNLGKVGQPAVLELVAALRDAQISYWVVLALGEIKDAETIEPLIKAMESDEEGELGYSIAEVLAKIGDKSLPYLIAALSHPNWATRGNATVALGLLKGNQAVSSIIKIFEENDYMLSPVAADALGKIGSIEAVEPLILLLDNEHSHVRSSAISALGKIGDKRAVEPILKFLMSKDVYERLFAAYALGDLGDARVLSLLEWVAQYDEGEVQNGSKVKDAAIKAITQIKESEKLLYLWQKDLINCLKAIFQVKLNENR